jgi:hypothetical protein
MLNWLVLRRTANVLRIEFSQLSMIPQNILRMLSP